VKKSWTKLIPNMGDFARKASKTRSKFNYLFCKHHRHACEMIYDKEGEPMAAIYFTPQAMDKEQNKRFFRAVQERTLYAYELEDGE
jgi:hypothetical protein